MKLFKLKLKNSCFYENPLWFFITVSLDVFISSCFHIFIFDLFRCFWVFSLLIAFVHFTVSLRFFRCYSYRKFYRFERAFFTLMHFYLTFISCYCQGFPLTGNSAWKVAGLLNEVRNTDSAHLFV